MTSPTSRKETPSVYLLDTNACIRFLNNSSPILVKRFRSCAPSEIFLCSIVKAELYYGARNSSKPAENLRVLETFFAPLVSLPFDDNASEVAGQLRTELKRSGTPIGPNDLLIAATAVANSKVLITNNVKEFSRVPGLKFEDWQTAYQ